MEEKPPAKMPESEEEQEKVIEFLEERLEKHDNNRKVVQEKLTEVRNRLTGQINNLEERIARELEEKFVYEEDRLQAALNKLRVSNTDSALQEAKRKLSVVQSYEIIENKKAKLNLTTLYELKTERRTVPNDVSVGLAISRESSSVHGSSNTTEKGEIICGSDKFAEERERLIELLEERLQTHDDNREAAQDKLHEICEGLRTQIVELEERVSKELEDKFTFEDDRLQAALNELRGNSTASALQKAKAELLVEQLYEIIKNNFDSKHDLTTLYKLKTERHIVPELTEMKKPINVRVAGMNRGSVSVRFTFLNLDEERVLSDNTIVNPVKYKCLLFKKGRRRSEKEGKEYPLDKNDDNDSSSFTFTPDTLETKTPYCVRVKVVTGDREHEWNDEVAEFTPEFKKCCVWKKCPGDVAWRKKYSVDEKNPRIATKVNDDDYVGWCTIIGNTYIPFKKVTSWSIKILKSKRNDGYCIFIGIAPFDINQNDYNCDKCGWYFDCHWSALCSGSPHSFRNKEYGPRKGRGQYVHTGDSVGVIMDTAKSELSFALNGVNLGLAFEGIPLDKPLVPCVILNCPGDSVELDTSKVKETEVDSSILVPSNITVKGTTWDSVTLTWDKVYDVSLYQIEVDESKSWDTTTTNTFTKRGLFPETEHSFRVRTVRMSSVSEWSGVVKGRTLEAPEFSECVWKKCPDDVYDDNKYSVNGGNLRVATMVNGYGECTIIGNTYIPPNTVTSWNIKILNSEDSDGAGIYIGVAPFGINQNVGGCNNNGWYFDCWESKLWSGPPHNYRDKQYGPRKEDGEYVHTGDSVGVVVDTTRGDLSFVLNGVNLGVAYEGIPLDKPLVPCVLLCYQGDSVELII